MKGAAQVSVALVAAMSFSCAGRSPQPARPTLRAHSADEAGALAERWAGDIVGEMLEGAHGPYADPVLAGYVQAVGLRVAKAAGRGDVVWRFRVTDDPAVSARALPGGRIVISRGTLVFLGSEAELAAVLGHEIAHVVGRHASGALGIENPPREQDRERFHDFNADQERQADALAVRYLARAGYDPGAVARAFEALRRAVELECRKETGRDDCLSSCDETDPHPAWPTRLARAWLAAGSSRGELGQERYLQRVDGLAFGDAGDAPRFVHGRFEARAGPSIAIPEGMRTELDGATLSSKGTSSEIVIVRAHGEFWRGMLLSALQKSTHSIRRVAGFAAVVGSFAEDAEHIRAALLDAGPFVYLIAVKGESDAAQPLLERLLDSVRPSAPPLRETTRLRVVPARHETTLARLCPATPPDLASAINGVTATERVMPGTVMKCLEAER